MRFVLIAFVVIFISLTEAGYKEEWKDLLKILNEECKKETNSDDESFLNTRKTGHVDRTNKKLMNQLICIAKNTAFIDDEGNINMDVCNLHLVKLGVAMDSAKKINELCASIKSAKKYDSLPLLISDYYECYHKNLPKEFLI